MGWSLVLSPQAPARAGAPTQSRCATISASPGAAKVGQTVSAQAARGAGWTSICGDSWDWSAPIGQGGIFTLDSGCGGGDGSCTVTANLAANGGTTPETVPICVESVSEPNWESCASVEILPLTLSGTVTEVTATGASKPAARVPISIGDTTGAYNRNVTTNSVGRYSVTLPARGTYVVRASRGFVAATAGAKTFDHLANSQVVTLTADLNNVDFSTKPESCEPGTATTAASGDGSCGELSVVEVTRGTTAVSAAVRVKLDDRDADASGCNPDATYAFSDPGLESTKAVGPCRYELTFRAPATGIYHVALRATEQSGKVIPVSSDQFGQTVDGRFTVVIESCSRPPEGVPDVDALLNPDDGTCDVMVGGWDTDATDVAADVVKDVERSRGLVLVPVPVGSADPADWPGRGLGVGTQTGWVPTGTSLPPVTVTKSGQIITGTGDAVALIDQVLISGLPDEWDGAGVAPSEKQLGDRPPATVIAAHGGWYTPNGLMRVPAGDEITTFVPISTIMNGDLGEDIDTGHIHGDDRKYLHVYTAGQLIPNFTFVHLDDETGQHVVNPSAPTTLSALVKPHEGPVWLATCEELFLPQGETVEQALSNLPIHTPGTGEIEGHTHTIITSQGQLGT